MDLDCGDNSCLFATDKGGMRTNGGCRCFEAHGFHRSQIKSAQLMLPEIIRLRAALDQLRTDIEDYAEDTVWVGLCETACERITSILGDKWEPK